MAVDINASCTRGWSTPWPSHAMQSRSTVRNAQWKNRPCNYKYKKQPSLVGSADFPSSVQLVDTESIHSSDPNNLVQMALQIQKADQFTRANACSKLAVIGEQVRFLQEQARKVLEAAHRNAELHHVACNFKKVPGQMYYLYRRTNGQRYFSRISPEEWGSSCPHEFIGAYKLQHDMSWTEEKDVEKKDDELHILHKIIDTCHSLQTSANLSIQFDCNP